MHTPALGSPAVLQQAYTRFYIHYLDLNRLEEVLQDHGIAFFAVETKVDQITWVLHIPDENRAQFDDLVVKEAFNLSSMTQSFWHQDREREAYGSGITSRRALWAIVVVVVLLLLVYLGALMLE